MGQFLVSEGAGETFPVARADGGAVLMQPAVGAGATGALVLIFPNIAALEAYNASSPVKLQQGQLAVVQSNNSLWELAPGSEAVDNITVASVTAPPFANAKWNRCSVSLALPLYLAQRTWVVDNVAGNDEAVGSTLGTALKTNAEVYRRWGYTWQPNLIGVANFSVQAIHASADGTDPTSYAPTLEDGASFTQFAALPAATFTGTLGVVTAKSQTTGTGNGLISTLVTATGAPAQDMLLVNTTRGNSRAILTRNTAGTTWLISQPYAAYAGGFPALTQVNTWANGDSVQGFALLQVDVARIGAKATTFDGSFDPAHLIQNMFCIDGNGNNGSLIIDSSLSVFENGGSLRAVALISTGSMLAENAEFPGTIQAFGTLALAGGILDSTGVGSTITSGATANVQDTIIRDGALPTLINCAGTMAIDATATVVAQGDFDITQSIYGAVVGAPGTFNMRQGTLRIPTNAATNLILADGTHVQLDGVTTGYSRVTTGGGATVTLHGNISLTHANIDAAASTTGFGGFAEGGGAFISINGVQP